MTPSQFRDLASGRQSGLLASVARGLLGAASKAYATGVALRNRRYDRGRAEVCDVGVPVISVGNLTLGGTGKTPLVAWIAGWCRERGIRVAVVSRGYGASRGQNDEARQLAASLPDVAHVQHADRVRASREAIDRHHASVLIADDGFQHRRLARSLDIVVVDALDPFGCGFLFPRGLLREPTTSLARADLIVLNRADLIAGEIREGLQQSIASLSHGAPLVEIGCRPDRIVRADGTASPLASLENERVLAFCGIGNPAGFRRTLEQAGIEPAAWREFADHHPFSDRDLKQLAALAATETATTLICTEKDLVKLPLQEIAGRPLAAVGIRLAILSGAEDLDRLLTAATASSTVPRAVA